MEYSPKKVIDERNVSTPERKREYIKRWIEENPLLDVCSPLNSNQPTPDTSLISPSKCKKELLKSTPPQSPALGEKRSASSPVFGGMRKSFKRMRVTSKMAKLTEEKPSCSKSIFKEEKISKLEKKRDPYFLEKTKISELQDTFNISTVSDDNKPQNNAIKVESHSTQFIESVTSDDNTEVTEFQVQEAASDADKTASDLIEDISTQMLFESPQKPKQTMLSQRISTPSSTSSDQTTDGHITESNTKDQSDPQITEIFTPADQIDSISTLESKEESSKTSYILQYTFENPQRKKSRKKGSLTELLHITLATERSSVTLLRHQLTRNLLSVANMPFVLLQILHFLPNFNGNQFVQCILIEDTANLLKNLVKKKTNVITVMNVPEISGMINVNQKPELKVYEPWTIVDPKQLLIHISRFIAIESSKEDLSFYNVGKKALKLTKEFHCPCIDKNVISNECNTKFSDCTKSSVKMICNYKS